MSLDEELEEIGRRFGAREVAQRALLEHIRARSGALHARVKSGLEGFHRGGREAGAVHLEVELSEPRIDDKHLHSVQFDLARGRHRLIVTAKAKGEVTLVGPFKTGKQEGPCKSIALDDDRAIDEALSHALCEFLEAAFAP